MNTIDKLFVKKSFNRHASTYDRNAGLQKSFGEELLTYLNGNSKTAVTILDIGMGTGNTTASLIQRFPEARIHGCDLAFRMISQARTKEFLNPQKDLFIAADGEYLPYRDNYFDLVISSFTYQWCESLDLAFTEALRVLKPGGRFLCSAFGDKTFGELKAAYARACHETSYTRGAALHLSFTEQNCAETLHSAGFSNIFTCSRLVTEFYSTVHELVRSIKYMGAQNASWKRSRTLGMRRLWDRMVDIYEHDCSPYGKIAATFEVIIGGGQKA
jgi:malonyl-CoA O-methyltransferase